MVDKLRYDFTDLGVQIEGLKGLRDLRFRLKFPLPPAAAFEPDDNFTPRRIAIDFEVVDNYSKVVEIDLTLIIYITQEDIDFADGEFEAVKIKKWVSESWRDLTIIERWAITPPIRSTFGERYVGFCKVSYNSKNDPSVAVGR
jgi:hypothetical protein